MHKIVHAIACYSTSNWFLRQLEPEFGQAEYCKHNYQLYLRKTVWVVTDELMKSPVLWNRIFPHPEPPNNKKRYLDFFRFFSI